MSFHGLLYQNLFSYLIVGTWNRKRQTFLTHVNNSLIGVSRSIPNTNPLTTDWPNKRAHTKDKN